MVVTCGHMAFTLLSNVAGTWNADFAPEMTPKDGDIIVTGKKGV